MGDDGVSGDGRRCSVGGGFGDGNFGSSLNLDLWCKGVKRGIRLREPEFLEFACH